MKAKRILAGMLVGIMLLGESVYAGDLLEEPDGVQIEGEQDIPAENGQSDAAEKEYAGQTQENPQETESEQVAEGRQEKEDGQETDSGQTAVQEYGDAEESALELYTGYPVIKNIYIEEGYDWDVTVEDETICTCEIRTDSDYSSVVGLLFKGITEGKTTVVLKRKGQDETEYTDYGKYTITVQALPENAVPFKDAVLITCCLESSNNVDADGDGCISFSELEDVEYLSCSGQFFDLWGGIHDLSGMENAKNLNYIELYGNAELEDIEPLFPLENLSGAGLGRTKVSLEDRLRLGRVADECHIFKGETWKTGRAGVLENVLFTVDKENEGILLVDVNNEVCGQMEGEAVVHLSLDGQTKDIKIIVDGFDENPPTGEYNDTVLLGGNIGITPGYGGIVYGDSNGGIWEAGSEFKKLAEEVLDYQTTDSREYLLDKNHILWVDGKVFAEDVESFDDRYLLTRAGVLKDIYTSGTPDMENVADWVQYDDYYAYDDDIRHMTYVLKNDGTLWLREEVGQGEAVNEFVQIDSQVSRLDDSRDAGYIKDGTVYSYGTNEPNAQYAGLNNIRQLVLSSYAGYYGTDGNIYLYVGDEGKYAPIGEESEIGKIQTYLTYDNGNYRFLTDKGIIFNCQWDGERFSLEKYVENVAETVSVAFGPDYFITEDGKYLDAEGNLISLAEGEQYMFWDMVPKIELWYTRSPYSLWLNADGTTVLKSNGIEILTNVKTVICSSVIDEYYAIRTDGTVWSLTGAPHQVADLVHNFLRGDVNEDWAVDIQDLRIILRGASGKIILTEKQETIADVTDDGTVDIRDLRKTLRYVCGKIIEL